MKTHTLLILGLLGGLLGAATTPAQALPHVWNRYNDWVARKNPNPDSLGDLVYSYEYRKGTSFGVSVWNPLWGGWATGTGLGGAAVITRGRLRHICLATYSGNYHKWSPVMMFKNVTSQSFMLKIGGKLRVEWPGMNSGTKAHDTPVTVEFRLWDSQTGWKMLLSKFIPKPTPGTKVEKLTFPVDLPAFKFTPRSFVYWTVRARDWSWFKNGAINLFDKDLSLTRTVVATETVRRASPPNPLTLSKGRTSRPLIGATWDPFIANSPSGATSDFLAFGVTAINVNFPFGTLLCDPVVIVTSRPGVPFSLPIPKDFTLIGTKLCTQGASATATGGIMLANALDIVVGDR